jgi:hypothetical protein
MIRKKTWYCGFRQPGRWQRFCCKEFRTRSKLGARRAAKRFAREHNLYYVSAPVKGRCPKGSKECR